MSFSTWMKVEHWRHKSWMLSVIRLLIWVPPLPFYCILSLFLLPLRSHPATVSYSLQCRTKQATTDFSLYTDFHLLPLISYHQKTVDSFILSDTVCKGEALVVEAKLLVLPIHSILISVLFFLSTPALFYFSFFLSWIKQNMCFTM